MLRVMAIMAAAAVLMAAAPVLAEEDAEDADGVLRLRSGVSGVLASVEQLNGSDSGEIERMIEGMDFQPYHLQDSIAAWLQNHAAWLQNQDLPEGAIYLAAPVAMPSSGWTLKMTETGVLCMRGPDDNVLDGNVEHLGFLIAQNQQDTESLGPPYWTNHPYQVCTTGGGPG